MPRVPDYGEQRVSLRPKNQEYISSRADASSFGSNTGRELIQFGQGVTNFGAAADWVEDQKAKADAKKAWADGEAQKRDLKYNPETGYMLSEGKNAIDGRPDYEKGLTEIDSGNGSKLSERAKKYYDDLTQSSDLRDKQQGIVHAGQQTKQYLSDASKSSIKAYADNTLADYKNDKAINQNISGALNEITEQANREGWSPETRNLKLKETESAFRSMVVSRLAESTGNSRNISGYIEKYKDNFTAADLQKLNPVIRKANATVKFFDASEKAGGLQNIRNGHEAAFSMLRQHEGFKSTTYWDVNAHRTGYGSDTITREDGSVLRVKPGMKVTREDAERDLYRRVSTEFIPKIINSVGADRWNKLSAGAQGALASVTYNYGSLPRVVAAAVTGGSSEAIAQSIESLRNHNNGVNWGRRMKEAEAVRSGMMGASSANGASSPVTTGEGNSSPVVSSGGGFNYDVFYKELSAISDPDEKIMAYEMFKTQLKTQDDIFKQQRNIALDQAFNLVEQGMSPSRFPPQVRMALGMEGVQRLQNYYDTEKTDDTLLYEMRKYAATSPGDFIELDLMQFRDRLGKPAFEELSKQQASILKKDQDGSDKLGLASAFSRANQQLQAVGITAVGKQRQPILLQKTELRIARFQNVLADRMGEFQKGNKRAPNELEVQEMINTLLLPVVLKKPGLLWGTNDKDGFVFDARYKDDDESVEINVKYNDVPVDYRQKIHTALKQELGRSPTEDEVTDRYEQVMTGTFR